MTTTEQIKIASCELFNKYGIANITLRDIGSAVGRSYGNITYYFTKKELLVESLYFDMQQELTQVSNQFQSSHSLLETVIKAPHQTFDISLKYAFLYKDYLEIMRAYPDLSKKVQANNEKRKQSLTHILKELQNQQLLNPDLDDDDIDYIMELSGAMRTIFFVQLNHQNFSKSSLRNRYVDYVNRLLYPYLTTEGKVKFKKLLMP